MGDEQNNTLLRKHKNTQNLNEKSNVLRSVFALHNRHISSGSIKEVINSKPDIKSFETFKEIIDELEPEKRGIYGGGVGYFSAGGDMDMCIALRTAILSEQKLYIQAGGGPVSYTHLTLPTILLV